MNKERLANEIGLCKVADDLSYAVSAIQSRCVALGYYDLARGTEYLWREFYWAAKAEKKEDK